MPRDAGRDGRDVHRLSRSQEDPISTIVDSAAEPVEGGAERAPRILRLPEHTVEVVSDSGEGAQKCGQTFGTISAKMGNGVWTVEIIRSARCEGAPGVGSAMAATIALMERIKIGQDPIQACHEMLDEMAAMCTD